MASACSLFAVSLYAPPKAQQTTAPAAAAATTSEVAVVDALKGLDLTDDPTPDAYGRLFGRCSVSEILAAGAKLAAAAGSEADAGSEAPALASDVVVAGWSKTGRVQGGGTFAFIELNDGSTPSNLQVIVKAAVLEEAADDDACPSTLGALTPTGTSLVVRGDLRRCPAGTKQLVEVHAKAVLYAGRCDAAKYPIAKKKTSFEFLRTQLHLRPRTNTLSAVARVRNALSMATHLFFQGRGFLYVHTPIITTSDAEGAGECFQVTTLNAEADQVACLPSNTGTAEHVASLQQVQDAAAEEVRTLKKASQACDATYKKHKDALKALRASKPEGEEAAQANATAVAAEEAAMADAKRACDEAKTPVVAAVARLGDAKAQVEAALFKQRHPDDFLRRAEEGPHHGAIDYKHDFFGKPAFLAVSGQLQGEAYACALSKIYTFGPTFRAENSHTTRHAAEFWMIEPEIAFADVTDVMNCAEDYVRFCCQHILDTCASDMAFFNRMVDKKCLERVTKVASTPFARVSYTDAVAILEKEAKRRKGKKKFVHDVFWGVDLATEHERFLAEEHFKGPTIVYNYPKEIKAFYMRLNDDDKTVAAFDVLVPGVGELVGGSQREERLDVQLSKLKEAGLHEGDYGWYLDLRRYGTVPHGGFGLGFERLVMFTTGIENIRETLPFPRWPGNADG